MPSRKDATPLSVESRCFPLSWPQSVNEGCSAPKSSNGPRGSDGATSPIRIAPCRAESPRNLHATKYRYGPPLLQSSATRLPRADPHRATASYAAECVSRQLHGSILKAVKMALDSPSVVYPSFL